MELLLKWLRGNLGEPGDFSYQRMHITTVIVIVLLLVLLAIVAKSNILIKEKESY